MTTSVPAPAPVPLALTAAGISAGLLLAALAFQHLGGLAPCTMCVLQRWPHVVAVLAGLWVWIRRAHPDHTWAMGIGAAACLVGTVLGGMHTGIELGLWSSPFGCGLPDWSDPNLSQTLAHTTPADCTQPAWTFLGHSMAAWNTLASSILTGIWAGSAVRAQRTATTRP